MLKLPEFLLQNEPLMGKSEAVGIISLFYSDSCFFIIQKACPRFNDH